MSDMQLEDFLSTGADVATKFMREKSIEQTILYINEMQGKIAGTLGGERERLGRNYRDALIHLGVMTHFAEMTGFISWYKQMYPHKAHEGKDE